MFNDRQSLGVTEIEQALIFIPADDREIWLRMGMAIKSGLGDAGFSIWDHWSQTAHNYNERDAQSVWRSINGSGISIGSLFHEAQQHGWQKNSIFVPRQIPRKPPPKPQPTTGAYAKSLWLAADWTTAGSHPYALSKGINWPAGTARGMASGKIIGQNMDCIIVPIRDLSTNAVKGVQCINTDGDKQSFGSLSGNGFICGNTLNKSIRWFVVEGWADAVSMVFHHYKGNAVAMAACGKDAVMETLAERIKEVFAPEKVIIVEDAA